MNKKIRLFLSALACMSGLSGWAQEEGRLSFGVISDIHFGNKVAEGPMVKVPQALKNITNILAEQGMTLDNVVKTTVFLADLADFVPMNEVYAQHFVAPFPARSAVAVRELPKQVLVEIEVIATR